VSFFSIFIAVGFSQLKKKKLKKKKFENYFYQLAKANCKE